VGSRPEWGIVLDLAPFLLALVYLMFLSGAPPRASPQTGTDPDVL
jgi:hypothetical protein